MAGSTVIDVIENACDGFPRSGAAAATIAAARVDELAEHLDRLYADWEAPGLTAGEMRTNAAGVSRRVIGAVLAELLYAHSAVVYDPLEWALHAPRRSTEAIAEALETLKVLAPLIRSGVIVTVPARRLFEQRSEEITAAAWEIVGEPGDFWWGLLGQETDPYGQRPLIAAKPWAMHLAIANVTGAQVYPVDEHTYMMYQRSLQHAAHQLRSQQHDLLMAPRVFAANLPWLAPTDPATLIAMHEQVDAFDSWRRALRRSTRGLRLTPGEEGFAAEAREAFDDELGPVVESVRAAAHPAIRAAKRPSVMFAASAVGIVGTSAVAGTAVGGPLVGAGTGESDGFGWPRCDGLKWPHFGLVGVLVR